MQMHSVKKAKVIACITAVALLIVIFIPKVCAAWQTSSGNIDGIELYTKGWYVLEDDRKIEVQLPSIKSAKAGEKSVFYHEIKPENWGRLLYASSFNEYFSVYADGTLIYERPTIKSLKNDRLPLSGYNYVKIPEGTEIIAIAISSPYHNYGGTLNQIYMADSEVPITYMNQSRYQFNNFIDTLMTLFGMIFFVYGVYLLCLRENAAMVTYLGCLLFCLGNLLRFGTVNIEIKYYTELQVTILAWLFWFLTPISLCLFLGEYFEGKKRKYKIIAAVSGLNILFNVCMVAAGAAELHDIAWISYLLMANIVLTIGYDVISSYKRGKMEGKKVGCAGFAILLILSLLEMIQFYFTKMPTASLLRYGIVVCMVFVGMEELYRREVKKLEFLKQEADKREILLKSTLSQLQPNFIFHTLGTIKQKIGTDSETACSILDDFSRFLRADLQVLQDEGLIPFSRELEQIKDYLNIQEKLSERRIRAVYEIETTDFKIPPLTIEPIVVNAVKNTWRMDKGVGTVTVRTYKQGFATIIEVEDDGIGFQMNIRSAEQEKLENKPEIGITLEDDSYMGMSAICNRLKTMMGAAIQIESESGKGTRVHIEIER